MSRRHGKKKSRGKKPKRERQPKAEGLARTRRPKARSIVQECKFKAVFDSEKQANCQRPHGGLTPYACKICGKWHLTGQNSGKRKE